jgi:molecular chaperone DnaK
MKSMKEKIRRRKNRLMLKRADSLVFQSEKQLKEFDAKLNPEMKMKIQTAVDRLKEAQKGTNTDEMKSAIEALNAAWNEASTQMYSQATGSEGAGQQEDSPRRVKRRVTRARQVPMIKSRMPI